MEANGRFKARGRRVRLEAYVEFSLDVAVFPEVRLHGTHRSVGCFPSPAPSSWLEARKENTGKGMGLNAIENILQRFFGL